MVDSSAPPDLEAVRAGRALQFWENLGRNAAGGMGNAREATSPVLATLLG